MKRIDSHDGDDREAEYDAPHTIDSITKAIESHGHTVVPLEATPDFPRVLMASNVDVVFNIAEGISGRNREAQVPNLCELLGVPYTGSDSATLSICLDKGLAKRCSTASRRRLSRCSSRARRSPAASLPGDREAEPGRHEQGDHDQERRRRRGRPSRARARPHREVRPAGARRGVRDGARVHRGLLGERRPRVLPPMEVVFLTQQERPVYDYECKQECEKHVRYEVPAKLTKEELRAIEKVCRATFMTLGCRTSRASTCA